MISSIALSISLIIAQVCYLSFTSFLRLVATFVIFQQRNIIIFKALRFIVINARRCEPCNSPLQRQQHDISPISLLFRNRQAR